MITNHGIHQWKIIPGLPDTGGQNVFVNQFSDALTKFGYKITIVNRGGFTHPTTNQSQTGIHYKDENLRILYLEDNLSKFIRKEDMHEQLPQLSLSLQKIIKNEQTNFDLIISHYWDGAKLGILLNHSFQRKIKHIWVPHSLGAVKKSNVKSSEWENLRIEERIQTEKEIINQLDYIVATSATIRSSLVNDYTYSEPQLFLPPCIDPDRYHPREISEKDPIWEFLNNHLETKIEEIYNKTIITEISRTDTTKRKDILIKAFSKVNQSHPDTLLLTTIDKNNKTLSTELNQLIESLEVKNKVISLGSIWDVLPQIYAITDIYCTPSIMEGFGMTPQEAAATKTPVVSSDLVPFATEFLLGEKQEKIIIDQTQKEISIGDGAIVVPADYIDGFAYAINYLIENPSKRQLMAKKAYQITIPYFTWENMVKQFLKDIQ